MEDAVNAEAAFAGAMEAFFGDGQVFLVSKGRVGLYAALRALGLGTGDRVLVPGYTCVVVPAAIRHAGCTPVYADIDPRTYNLDPNAVEDLDPDGIRAVVIQHTYGVPASMSRLMAWAEENHVAVVEDCCHAFGSRWQGRLVGTFGVAAFFSGQWNKPFSTGLGGMLLVSDPATARGVEEILEREAQRPGPLRELVLSGQILAHRVLVSPARMHRVTEIYQFLAHAGLAVGSSEESELFGEVPSSYLSRMARCQARAGRREMTRVDANLQHRRHLTAYYDARLTEIGFAPLALGPEEDAVVLRYPVRVGNKGVVLEAAGRRGVELGSWFESPLHPSRSDEGAFQYRAGSCPRGERASSEVVNLPTHRGVKARDAEAALGLLAEVAIPVPRTD